MTDHDPHPLTIKVTGLSEEERQRWLTRAREVRASYLVVFDARDIIAATELEHDPDRGCTGCPLLRIIPDYDGHDRECSVTDEPCEPTYAPNTSAPSWCPLRTGDVLVRRKR